MRFKGVIFDLDGTLIDTVQIFMGAYNHALKSHGFENIGVDSLKSNLGPNEEGVFKKLAPKSWEECLFDFYDFEKKHSDSVFVFDGVKELLNLLLANGVRLALVTGRAKFHADFFLHKFHLFQYFDIIRYGEAHGDIKAENIRFVLTKWNLNGDTVAYVGDTTSDALAAIQAGVIPLLANWSKLQAEEKPTSVNVNEFLSADGLRQWLGNTA